MPRTARLDAAGALHHVMIRGIERKNIFRGDRDRNNFIERLASLLPETGTTCYAWALIPNHAHFLFRSGPPGIASLMRRLLTGYAVFFNRRYHRSGQLFQNRYKSVICQEDIYFKELVRYIHLNPLRAHIIHPSDLDVYPYCGHSALMGKSQRTWQDTSYVLRLFGNTPATGRKKYRAFVESGFDEGKRNDLTGGGLMRSYKGWVEIRQEKQRLKGDERILGDSDFVSRILSEAHEDRERRLALQHAGYTLNLLANRIASLYNVNPDDILSKGRRKIHVEARDVLCHVAVHDLGITVTDLARRCHMSPSSITYAVMRGKKIAETKNIAIDGHGHVEKGILNN